MANPNKRAKRGYLYFDDVFVPPGVPGSVKLEDVRISKKELDLVERWNASKHANCLTAWEVLKNPDRVYRHIRDGDDEWGWCYSARIPSWRNHDLEPRRMHPDHVFTVYLNEEEVVFEWRAEACDDEDRYAPLGSVTKSPEENLGRFGGLVWKRPGTA